MHFNRIFLHFDAFCTSHRGGVDRRIFNLQSSIFISHSSFFLLRSSGHFVAPCRGALPPVSRFSFLVFCLHRAGVRPRLRTASRKIFIISTCGASRFPSRRQPSLDFLDCLVTPPLASAEFLPNNLLLRCALHSVEGKTVGEPSFYFLVFVRLWELAHDNITKIKRNNKLNNPCNSPQGVWNL